MADPLDQSYLDAIKGFEGFSPKASWDYAQHSNGYGTKAAYPGETIDQATADQRFRAEIGNAASQVDTAFPQLPDGARAALTSLTYNAGPGWIKSGLGEAVRSGDWATARNHFLQYNRAGGQVLPGLASRRAQEAAWLTGAQSPQPATPQTAGLLGASAMGAQSAPAGVPLFAQSQQPDASQANLGNIGLSMMAPQMPMPQVAPMQLRRPQVDYSGLQRLLSGQRGFA